MSEYRLEVRGVTKVFPGTRALIRYSSRCGLARFTRCAARMVPGNLPS